MRFANLGSRPFRTNGLCFWAVGFHIHVSQEYRVSGVSYTGSAYVLLSYLALSYVVLFYICHVSDPMVLVLVLRV